MLWNRSNDFLKFVLALACAWVLIPAQNAVCADEKDEAKAAFIGNFIAELRLNGFADLGIYYLEQCQKDGTLPESFKSEYDFQMAVLTDASADLAHSYDKRLEKHDMAIKLLDKYISEHPEGANYYLAIGLLPNIRLNKSLVYQAKGTFNDPSLIDDSKMNAEEKKELEKRKVDFAKMKKECEELGRKELTQNVEFLTKYEKAILEKAKVLDEKDPNRDKMLNELHSIRLARANTYYELSKTYTVGAKERNENLEKARLQYKFFWDKYREAGLIIAYRGHVNEAKMCIEMKKYTGKGEAIEILADLYSGLKDLVSQDAILREVFVEVCTCYLKIFSDKEAGVKPDKDQAAILMETIESFDPSKAGSILRSYDMEGSDVGIQMRLAYIAFMEHFLDLNKPKTEAKTRAALKEDVRRLNFLPPNPYMMEIIALHTKYFPEEHIGDADTTLTFANYKKEIKAKQTANLKKRADQRDNLYLEMRKFALKEFSNFFKARTELQTTTDDARRKELQEIVTNNPEKILEVFETLESLKYDILRAKQYELLTIDRFYRAQMYYVTGNQYEAIALLDFIAKRYEGSMQASNALFYELAYMNALVVNEYRELKKAIQGGVVTASPADVIEMFRGELELLASCIEMKEKMLAAPEKYGLNEVDASGNPVAKPITKDPMSFEWERLCKLCLMVGAVDLAQEYITKIPADHENRAALELSIGFSLWNMYIEFKRASDDEKPFSLEEANGYQKLALELLESGAQKLRKQVKSADDVTDTVLSAAMTLCDSYSRRGDNKSAIAWLRDEKIGPYKLMCDDHPTVTDARKDRILNIALVAFVSENDMESAFDAMDRLEKLAASDTDGDMDEKLTRKYMSLGFQLRDNLQSMVASGDEESLKQVKVVQSGFEEFLKRIQARENGNSYASLNWIAQTFISLAEGSQEGGANATINEESKKYFEAAISTYQTMVEQLKSNADFVQNADEEKIANLTILLQRKIAETCESLGDFETADKYYRMVLTAKPGLMELQYRMMNMYVAWSRATVDDMKRKSNLLVQANQGIKSENKKATLCRGWSGVIRGLNSFILPGSDPQKRWMYYYATLRETEVNFLYGQANGGYGEEKGKKAIDRAFSAIRGVFDGGNGSSDDFGGSVEKLDAEGLPTGEYVMVQGIYYEPLAGKYEALLKRVQEARGEEPTGFAGWTREVVEETPIDADAFTATQIEDNDQLVELENSRLAREEDLARKMMTPKVEPTPQYVIYIWYSVGGVAVLVVLFLIMRGGGGRSAKRRKAMLAAAKVPNSADGFKAESPQAAPVSIGLGDEVVDNKAAAGVFASMGFGDAPVIEEAPAEEVPAFSFDFSAPASTPASTPVAPTPKAPVTTEKPVVKKVVKKPAQTTSAPATGDTPVEKKVVKKVVKKPVEGTPTEKPEKTPEKKVIKLVKKPTDEK